MAVSSVNLPNGERVDISHADDATEEEVLNFAFREYVTNTDPGSPFGRGIRDGVDLLQTAYGSTLEGIGSLLDSESLQQIGADVIAEQRAEMDAEMFRQQRFGEQDEGIVDYTLNIAGASLPQMGATLGGAGAGATAGFALGGPLGVVPGAAIGGFLANMPYFYGSNRERQKEAIEQGFRTEMDEGAAALYAVPSSVLDAAFATLGAKFLSTGLLKGGGGLLTRATRGAVEGSIIEAPTELGQQFLERYQAGLPIDSDEAKLEYAEAAKGGALLGGLFGGGGRAVFGSKEGPDAMPQSTTQEQPVEMTSVETPEGEAVSPDVGEILGGQEAGPGTITEPDVEISEEDQAIFEDELQEELSQEDLNEIFEEEDVTAGTGQTSVTFNNEEVKTSARSKSGKTLKQSILSKIGAKVPKMGAVRLNLNSFFNLPNGRKGVLQTVHSLNENGLPDYSKAVAYGNAYTIKNARTRVNPLARALIALGVNSKSAMASVDGEILSVAPSLEGTVISFNPKTNSAFVDSQGRPVAGADEITVHGSKAYARGNIQYADSTPEFATKQDVLNYLNGEPYKGKKFSYSSVGISGTEAQKKQKLEKLKKKVAQSDELTFDEVSDVTVGAAPFTAPQKAPLSEVEQKDIIDIDGLIDEIVDNDIPVWFWYADQLGQGNFKLPNGGSVNLDAGPSYALTAANRAAGRVWASGKSAKEINNKISQLKYTDKDGKEQTGYIFLVSGSPDKMFLFNKNAFLTFYKNAFQERGKNNRLKIRKFSDVKKEILANGPTKPVRDALANHKTLKSLIDSADSRPFIEALINQRGKNTPLATYLDSKGFFEIQNSQLRDGFYRENNFNLNDILLVVQPTKGVQGNANHGTYKNAVLGKVIGVPDKRVDAYLLIPDEVRANKSITMEPAMSAQVVAPYGARVTNIKKIVGSDQAQRAVANLRRVIEESPDGFTIDTRGEFADGGYIVAPEKSTEQIIDQDKFTDEALTQYIINNSANLNIEGAMLGGWYNSDKKQYVLDVVFAIDTLQDAVDIAIWGDQDAIFNLDTSTEIRTKDDNENPTTPQEDTRTASEILGRKPTQSLGQYSSERRRIPRGVRQAVPGQAGPDVTVGADPGVTPEEVADTINDGGSFSTVNALDAFIQKNFAPIAAKFGVDIVPNYAATNALQYNVNQGVIEYNPVAVINNDKNYLVAGMREELIHASMHRVLINRNKGKDRVKAWQDFMTALGKDMTQEQRDAIAGVYGNLQTDADFGAEYSRAVIQEALYGDITEQYAKGKAYRKLKALFRSIQNFVARTLGSDVSSPDVAGVIRASADLLRAVDPTVRPTQQVIVQAAVNNSVNLNSNAEVTSQDAVNAGLPPSKRKVDLNFADKYIYTVTSVLGKIHPRLKVLIRDYYSLIQAQVLSYQSNMAPFFKKLKGIKNKADKLRLKQLLMYSPETAEGDANTREQETLLAKYGMLDEYRSIVRPSLDKLRADLEAQGVDVGFLFDYFPRKIKNFKALQAIKAAYGKTVGKSFRDFIEAKNNEVLRVRRQMQDLNDELVKAANDNNQAQIDKINQQLSELSAKDNVIIQVGAKETAVQEAALWDEFITNLARTNPDLLPGNVNARTLADRMIPDELLQYYEDPAVAMEGYIFNVVSATETIKLIGSRFVTNKEGTKMDSASKLGMLIQELRSTGGIIDEQADRTIPEIMKLILSPKKGESRILQLARSFGYGSLLVEFTSTLSQLYDLPFIMLDNGLIPTFSAMFSERLKGEDFGIDTQKVSQEFVGDDKFLESAVRFGLRSTGFTKLDQIMKETNLTANYNRYRKLSKLYYRNRNDGKIKNFKAELTALGYSQREQDKLISDLKDNKKDSALVRSLLFNKLAETQPLTSAEMAMGVVGNPNLRIAVAMKSFMVKQMVFAKDRILTKMVSKNKAERLQGSKDMVKLLTFMLLCGIPVDALKDFLAGRVGYMGDYLFDGTFRIAGVSRYTGYKIRSEGIGRATFDYFTPVAFQQAMDATGELQKVMSGERALSESKFVQYAPYSDVVNRMFGFQKERERRTLKRKAAEGESPLFIPPGTL